MPMLCKPHASAAARVDPEPANGSSTTPLPSGKLDRTNGRRNACGFRDGCGAMARSGPRAGADFIKSLNGSLSENRRSPPVPHFRRLSWTRPSQGRRKIPHGSKHDFGMTVTSTNSSCAFFGRSPPRSVCTSRINIPRCSNPAEMNGSNTKYDNSGFVAINTWAPGTSTGYNNMHSLLKNCRIFSLSCSRRTVNLGSGWRRQPSKAGGMRHTPPLPFRRLTSSLREYSTSPYGGSVTTA